MNSLSSNEEIDIIWQRYPSLTTVADIFTRAILTQDIDTVRLIALYWGYLPITWDLYIDVPTNILSLFLDKMSQELVAYRLKDEKIIYQYPINYKLAIRYNIIPVLRNSPISILVQGLSPDDIIPRITTATSEEYLEQALIHGRVDLVKAILDKYGKLNLDLLIPKYQLILTVPMIKYLLPSYPSLSSILIDDDPSQILSPILSESQILKMFLYDLIRIYEKYGANRISPFAHGDIRRRILESNTNISQLQVLLPHLKHRDLNLALQAHQDNKDLRLFYLKIAQDKEFMDILDKYMQSLDVMLLYVYHPSDRFLNLLNYKYGDLGYKIQDGKMDEQLIMASLKERNPTFLQSILKYYPLSDNRKKKLQLLIDQYQLNIKI